MKAVDTNILVRWITRDDPVQSPLANAIMAEPVYVPTTVLLEVAWVLGGRTYRYDRKTLAEVLKLVLQTQTVVVSHPDAFDWAVDRFAVGGDIADMIHIATAGRSDAFVSFEKHLADHAGAASPLPIEQPA